MEQVGYALLAAVAATAGALGGLGGAVILVPALVVTGMAASTAAPLGLLTVAAGSIAAGPRQLADRTVNHRLGVSVELVASAGAVVGAVSAGHLSDRVLTYFLAVVAAAAAIAGGARKGIRNLPDPAADASDIGERVGSLDGAYPLEGTVVPYRAARFGSSLGFMALAGFIAGTSGAAGGFVKTPAMAELMRIPMKVAAATTTFTVGITASTALVVMAVQGRIDSEIGAVVVVGSLVGGQAGAHLQSRLRPATVRRVLSILLVVVAATLVVRA